MYTDGQIITKADYTKCANWINANGNQFEILSNGDGTYTVKEIVIKFLNLSNQEKSPIFVGFQLKFRSLVQIITI
jgi:hypothetical protein